MMLRIVFSILVAVDSVKFLSQQIPSHLVSFKWYNEPAKWSSNSSTITVHTDGNTDFWRKTHYGFERDSGHFYFRSLAADQSFTVTVNVQGNYKVLYDQAGLMLRTDENNWLKCGIEYVDGRHHASVVVTVNGWSDWSFIPLDPAPTLLRLRVKREREAVHVEYGDGHSGELQMMRLAYLPVTDSAHPMMVGIMCASPNNDTDGFDVTFEQLNIIEHQSDHGTHEIQTD